MNNNRGFGIFLFQLILGIAGAVGLFFLTYLFIPAARVIFGNEANIGDVIATVLFFLPFVLLISPVVCLIGIITFAIAVRQRKNPDTKDAFSLIMTIYGFILIVLPIAMVSMFFIASRAKETETALYVGNYLIAYISLIKF